MHEFQREQKLASFLEKVEAIPLTDQIRLVKEALVLFQSFYVNLPLKEAVHAADPVRRLILLLNRLKRQASKAPKGSASKASPLNPRRRLRFHYELRAIFNSVRDLHTIYSHSRPFGLRSAYLGFDVEAFYDESSQAKYLVSRVGEGVAPEESEFEVGVEVLTWNGMPISRAVERDGERHAGSNEAARHARGLTRLTYRPLQWTLPPDEDWVAVGYRTEGGKEREVKVHWRVLTTSPDAGAMETDEATTLGLDFEGGAVRHLQRHIHALASASRPEAKADPRGEPIESRMQGHMKAWKLDKDHGYIRLYSFSVRTQTEKGDHDVDDFVQEFQRLLELLPRNGLILDVRENRGGNIHAAERLLQLLSPGRIEPERFQFLNTPANLALAAAFSDGKPWLPSLEQAVETSSAYSGSFPITPRESCNDIGQKYHGPVVLITDALCYSATDMFAAGFQDHEIGEVLGTDEYTGAGGANVVGHRVLRKILGKSTGKTGSAELLKDLPEGAEMKVALRRSLRVGKNAGTILEDYGVQPNRIHRMTRRDLLGHNVDLIAAAARMLGEKQSRQLDVELSEAPQGNNGTFAEVTVRNLSRVDAYVDDRPFGFNNIKEPTDPVRIELPEGAKELRLEGFNAGVLVAARRTRLSGQGAVELVVVR